MVSLESAIVARWEKSGLRFEVLVDPELPDLVKEAAGRLQREGASFDQVLAKLRTDPAVGLDDRLASDEIFKDHGKGDRAADENLQKAFGTKETGLVALTIMLKGEVQLTTDQRREMQERKRKQIVALIARNAINPQTGGPHPPLRIETAMKDAKVTVDPFRSVDAQVKDVLDKLRPILPIRFERVSIAIKLPGTEYAKVYTTLRDMGSVQKEEWTNDGSWIGVIEIPAGLQTELYDAVNARTKGRAEVRKLDKRGV